MTELGQPQPAQALQDPELFLVPPLESEVSGLVFTPSELTAGKPEARGDSDETPS